MGPDLGPADAKGVLSYLGVDATETNMAQMAIILEAFNKFLERNAEWQDLFKKDSPERQMDQMGSKLARLGRAVTDGAFEDSGLDLINYAAFAVRNRRGI